MTTLATSSFDASVAGYLIGGVVLICAFVLVELHQAEPMLDLSLFKVPTLAPSLLASLFQGLANFAVLFLVIMYLQGPRGLSPIHASLLLVPGYVVGSGVGPYAGRLADRFGPVLPATVGLGVQVVALFIYAHLSLSSGLWLVVVASVVNGVGASGFFPANSSAVMKASPPQMFGISSGCCGPSPTSGWSSRSRWRSSSPPVRSPSTSPSPSSSARRASTVTWRRLHDRSARRLLCLDGLHGPRGCAVGDKGSPCERPISSGAVTAASLGNSNGRTRVPVVIAAPSSGPAENLPQWRKPVAAALCVIDVNQTVAWRPLIGR